MVLGVYRELLPQGQLDDGLLLTGPEQGWDRGEENEGVRDEGSDHEGILSAGLQEIEAESPALLLAVCPAGDSAAR